MLRFILLQPLLHQLHHLAPVLVANEQVHSVNMGYLVRGSLGIAARYHDKRLGVPFGCPADHLPGLALTHIGHHAGIDQIDVRRLLKIHNRKAGFPEQFLHGCSIRLVYLAAQGIKSYFFHLSYPPKFPVSYMMAVRAARAAVSVRIIRGPRLTDAQPSFWLRANSSLLMPPSGPIIRAAVLASCCT